MSKPKTHSNFEQIRETTPVLSHTPEESKRLSSTPSSLSKTLLKPPFFQISSKALKTHLAQSLSKSKENLFSNTNFSNSKLESSDLLKSLKSRVLKDTKELNQILKLIPKYTARKVQDLKKGYKNNETYEVLAACFLKVFGELDSQLGLEINSFRVKIGQIFTNYLSNSARFLKLLKSLPELLRKIEITNKTIKDSVKCIENVEKEKLSNNYQDLFDFLYFILDFLACSKSLPRPSLGSRSYSQNKRNKMNEETFAEFLGSGIFRTYEQLESNEFKLDTSFLDIKNLLTCQNKNNNFLDIFDTKLLNTHKIEAIPDSFCSKSFENKEKPKIFQNSKNRKIFENHEKTQNFEKNSSSNSLKPPGRLLISPKPGVKRNNTTEGNKINSREKIATAKKHF